MSVTKVKPIRRGFVMEHLSCNGVNDRCHGVFGILSRLDRRQIDGDGALALTGSKRSMQSRNAIASPSFASSIAFRTRGLGLFI
jgi:hypothetical protein